MIVLTPKLWSGEIIILFSKNSKPLPSCTLRPSEVMERPAEGATLTPTSTSPVVVSIFILLSKAVTLLTLASVFIAAKLSSAALLKILTPLVVPK